MNNDEIRRIIREKKEVLQSGDYHAILGVSRDANLDEIKNAYFSLAKILHPDAILRRGMKDLEKDATEVFKAISEAYTLLTDPKKKAEQEKKEKQATQPVMTPRGIHMITPGGTQVTAKFPDDKVAQARVYFRKGSLLYKERHYDEAQSYFAKAAELDPTQPKYMTSLGMTIMQNEKYPMEKRLEEARKWFKAALDIASGDCEPYYFMSLYYKAVGDEKKQRAFLQDALNINPKHIESLREMRLLNMRSKKKEGIIKQLQELISKITRKKKT